MVMVRNIIQLLIILLLGIYIVYSKVNDDADIPVRYKLAPDYEQSFKVYTYDVPKKMDFAGEQVPLQDIDVMERFDREIHINTYWHSSTIFLIKKANRWLPQIGPILEENGIPEDFKYLPVIESGLTNGVSPRGATGFWQLMPETARELGLEVNDEVDERYHPLKSTQAACKYLKKSYARFGNWTNVAASYNIGMYGLDSRLEKQRVESYYELLLNEETSRYVFRILAIKRIMENPRDFGYMIPKKHLYRQEPVRTVTVDTTLNDLVSFAASQGINYKILKQYNPWLRKNKLTIKDPGESYTIVIPENPPEYNVPEPDLKQDTLFQDQDSLRIEDEELTESS